MTTPRVALLLLAVAALGFAPAARAPRRARAAPPAAKPKTFEQWQRHRAGQERSAAAKEIGLDSLVRGFAGLVGVDPGVLAKRYAPAPEDDARVAAYCAARMVDARALLALNATRREAILAAWEAETAAAAAAGPAGEGAEEEEEGAPRKRGYFPPEEGAEVDVSWDLKVQFEAQRDGNRWRQNEILRDQLNANAKGGQSQASQ